MRASLDTIRTELLRLKWQLAALRFQRAMQRHALALKAYNPEQPRDDHGRWTDDGSSTGRIRLAGDIPTNDPPEIPKERPSTSAQRTAALKAAARLLTRLGGPVGNVIEIGSWAYNSSPLVESYRDPPKSLDELQQAVSTPALGYDIHHIVEQTQAEREGFTREVIDSPENLVRIPTMKHWEINAWYQTANPNFGGYSPREYLSGRNWDVRRAVGLDALRFHEVLKP